MCPRSALPSPPNSPVGDSGLSLLTPVENYTRTGPEVLLRTPRQRRTVPLLYIEKSKHAPSDKELASCSIGKMTVARWNTATQCKERRTFSVPCRKLSCPNCAKARARKLRARLNQIRWPDMVKHWMITHNPHLSCVPDNIATLGKRWNNLNRALHRLQPKVKYFKCLELKDGWNLHIHMLTANYIPAERFKELIIRHGFGFAKFTTIPRHQALRYATKYVTKGILEIDVPENWPAKFWSASLFFIPLVVWIPENGKWSAVRLEIGSFVINFKHQVDLNHSPRPPTNSLGVHPAPEQTSSVPMMLDLD